MDISKNEVVDNVISTDNNVPGFIWHCKIQHKLQIPSPSLTLITSIVPLRDKTFEKLVLASDFVPMSIEDAVYMCTLHEQ